MSRAIIAVHARTAFYTARFSIHLLARVAGLHPVAGRVEAFSMITSRLAARVVTRVGDGRLSARDAA